MDDLEDDMLLDWSRQFRNLLHLHQSISAIATATACWFGLKAVTFFSVKPWNLLMFELLIWQESGLWCVHGVVASYCHNGWQWGKPSNYHALVSYVLLNWTNRWIASKLKYQSCKGIALAVSKPHAEIGIRFSDSWSPNTWNKKISLMGLFWLRRPELDSLLLNSGDCPSSKADPSQNELRMLCVQSFYRVAPQTRFWSGKRQVLDQMTHYGTCLVDLNKHQWLTSQPPGLVPSASTLFCHMQILGASSSPQ